MEIRPYTNYVDSEILNLYSSVGWTAYTDEPSKLKMGFENSLCVLAAYEGDKLQGIIRVVGDGHTIILIQDILVFPDFQRKGVGSALLKAILGKYSDVRQIQLSTDNTEKTKSFYRSMGFHELSEYDCCAFMK